MNLFLLHRKPLRWLKSKLDRNTFMVISCILVGITTGAAAVAMKSLVHFINRIVTNDWGLTNSNQTVLTFLFPLLGILLTVLVVHFVLKGKDGKGLSNLLYSVLKKGSNVDKMNMYSQLITTPITVGLGGSTGLEAPIVITGSAIGSNYGSVYHLNYRDKTLLLASGAAAGIAGIFNAPIAGLMFAMEVILAGVTILEFIPLILASVAGTLFCQIVLKENILFEFSYKTNFDYTNSLYYVLLGLLCAFYCIIYIRMQIKIEKIFTSITNKWVKALIGGLFISIAIAIFPSLFGEGYHTIVELANVDLQNTKNSPFLKDLLQNELYLILFIGFIGILKGVITSTTIFSGGHGGNFAPSLFVGAHVGFFFTNIISYFKITILPSTNFIMVAMAGILSGVMYAPITAIFLIAEVTGGYGLIIPLMIVSSISYFTVKKFQPYSLAALKLKEKGTEISGDKDSNLLNVLELESLVDKKAYCLHVNDKRPEIIKALQRSSRNIFPVVNKDKQLKGIVLMDQLKEILFSDEEISVKSIMRPPDNIVLLSESMVEAMKKFDEHKSWSLPVLDGDIFIGMLSKSSLLTAYRNELVKQSS